MPVYNLTGIADNSSTIVSFMQGVDQNLMFGWMGIFFLVSICVVLFTSYVFTTGEVKKALTATAFVAVGLSILLQALNLVPVITIYITLILSATTIAFTWK